MPPSKENDSGGTSARAKRTSGPTVAGISDGWRARLIGGADDPDPCVANVLVALEHAGEWHDVLRFDASSLSIVASAKLPWVSDLAVPFKWRDKDDIRAAAWLQRNGIKAGVETTRQGIQTVAQEHPFHPIRDYLNSLAWDGESRIDYFVPFYLGAGGSEYNQAVGSKWLIGAVARVLNPGCKNDCCLILEGDQGLLKGSALKILASPRWFNDSMPELGSKDSLLQMRGKWIHEFSELAPMKDMDIDRLKTFISCTEDRFRPPYGRYVIDVPRECVFAGTVNRETYLKDETGARRFWPVLCGDINLDELRRDRDQLWAEAVARFRAGEKWWLHEKHLVEAARNETKRRYVTDPWDEKIENWSAGRKIISIAEILGLCLGKKKEDWTQRDQNRVARSLRSNDWRRRQRRDEDGKREWYYEKASEDQSGD